MTDKLFYQDAYCKTFSAVVIACEQTKNGWSVILDATAFYPEGGGQPADTGVLGGVQVLDVHDRDGVVYHATDAPLTVGETVAGAIDWERRFSLMQNHTGEHIVSGWINQLYHLDNVGFHMGHDAITIDFNGELTAEQLMQVETLANQAVYSNLPVEKSYPSPEALAALAYRSKKELSGAVRIVSIADCDVCACCGLHLDRTGEVGAIKLISSQRYKGGIRIWMLCGSRAIDDYTMKNNSVAAISGMLSAKPHEVTQAVQRMLDENDTLKQKIAVLQNRIFADKAKAVEAGTSMVCLFEEALSPAELRKLCLLLCERCGVAAVFSESGKGGFQYAIGSLQTDVRPLGKLLNSSFSGRGGGAKELVQGSCEGTREQLRAFVAEQAAQ